MIATWFKNIAREREFSALSLLRFPFFLAVLLSNFSFKYFRHSLVLNWSKFPSSEDTRPAADEWKHQFQFIFQYQWNSARSMALVSMFPVQSVLRKSRPGFPARGHDSEFWRPLFGCTCSHVQTTQTFVKYREWALFHFLFLELYWIISVFVILIPLSAQLSALSFVPKINCFPSV